MVAICIPGLDTGPLRAQLPVACNHTLKTRLLRPPNSSPVNCHYVQLLSQIRLQVATAFQEAISINKEAKTVTVKSKDGTLQDLQYDSAFIATGGTPRTLKPMDGWNSSNIHVLRTVDEANEVANSCQGHYNEIRGNRICDGNEI